MGHERAVAAKGGAELSDGATAAAAAARFAREARGLARQSVHLGKHGVQQLSNCGGRCAKMPVGYVLTLITHTPGTTVGDGGQGEASKEGREEGGCRGWLDAVVRFSGSG